MATSAIFSLFASSCFWASTLGVPEVHSKTVLVAVEIQEHGSVAQQESKVGTPTANGDGDAKDHQTEISVDAAGHLMKRAELPVNNVPKKSRSRPWGPEPVSVLENDFFQTTEAKLTELRREMVKHQTDYWMGKRGGSTRLHLLKKRFEKSRTDYESLTGQPSLVEFHEEEPRLRRHGRAYSHSLAEGTHPEENTSTLTDHERPDPLAHSNETATIEFYPPCVWDCNETGRHATVLKECSMHSDDFHSQPKAERCNCMSTFLNCALENCHPIDMETGGLLALRETLDEQCEWDQSVIDDLRMQSGPVDQALLTHSNVSATLANQSEGFLEIMRTLFEQEDPSFLHLGLQIQPIIHTQEANGHASDGSDSLEENDLDQHNLMRRARRSELLEDTISRKHGAVEATVAEIPRRRRRRVAPSVPSPPPKVGIKVRCTVGYPEWVGDGYCDTPYNTEGCNYDGGDCCSQHCRDSVYTCGLAYYSCGSGASGYEPVKFDDIQTHPCSGKRQDFINLYKSYRNKMTQGASRNCGQLTYDERIDYKRAWNIGISIGGTPRASASAGVGGPAMSFACGLWADEMGSNWFGTLFTHEMGHIAGYSHPDTEESGTLFNSDCRPIGQNGCLGHCTKWKNACVTHYHYGSWGCGLYDFGCQNKCTHNSYCHSMPEKATECMGFQKVHSRG